MLFSQTALYALPRPVQGFSETIGNSQSRATVPDGLAEHFGSFFGFMQLTLSDRDRGHTDHPILQSSQHGL